jgi:hypothetical protein
MLEFCGVDVPVTNRGVRFRPVLLRRGGGLAIRIKIVHLHTGEPVDLTGQVLSAQVRDHPGGRLVLDLTPYLTVDTPPTGGVIRLRIPASATRTIPVVAGWWDLRIARGVAAGWIGWGRFTIEQETTHD